MKIGLKVAALVSILLLAILSAAPPFATAPAVKAGSDCQRIEEVRVCFDVLLTSKKASISGPAGFGGTLIDTWLYVTNPSTKLDRPAGEDNVLVESFTLSFTDPDGTGSGDIVLTPDIFADRWNTVIRASETQRVFFLGWNFGPTGGIVGIWEFAYELALTFRGVSFTLAMDFTLRVIA